MSARRLVVLSVSAGAGHVRAGAALCEAAAGRGIDTLHIDVLQGMPRWFRWLYADLYATLVNRAPLLWSWLYARMNAPGGASIAHHLRRALERRLSRRWLGQLDAFAADAIVCTHFLPAEVLARRPRSFAGAGARDYGPPVFVHVTDFDVHAMWLQPGVAGYFVGSDEAGFQLRRAGVAPAAICVSGIAVMPVFSQPLARCDLAGLYGFDASRPIVLLMGGGGGFGALVAVAEQLLLGEDELQLLVLAGRNADALCRLQGMAPRWPGRLASVGFTDQVATLMASADIVITKPGGLTTAECLAVGVAMIVNAPIPGQEERNADYLLEQGAALKAVDAATLAWRLGQLLDAPDRRAAMAQRASSLGRPDAAAAIVERISHYWRAHPAGAASDASLSAYSGNLTTSQSPCC